jgi:hypothetical protein
VLFKVAVILIRSYSVGGMIEIKVMSNGGMILKGKTEVLEEKHYTAWVVDG